MPDFKTPWLLLGLLAAAIPVLLHLLSSVRAPQAYFPTLRFLRLSMTKTARRRRVEHWLLLLIRSALLALLALAVAEPFLKASGGLAAAGNVASEVIIDNSYSMGVRSGAGSRFDRARQQAKALLGEGAGAFQPSVRLTNRGQPPAPPGEAEKAPETAEEALDAAALAPGRASLAGRVVEAVQRLSDQSAPRKAVYVFSDLQQISFRPLLDRPEIKQAGVPLLVVDCSADALDNVGIADVQLGGAAIVNEHLELTASLVNSSDKPKRVKVSFHLDGRQRGEARLVQLDKAGRTGAKAIVGFRHKLEALGFHLGQVVIDDADDLAADNVWQFCLEVGDRVQAVLVRGRGEKAGPIDPGMELQVALDPYAGSAEPWRVSLRSVAAGQFGKDALAGAQVVFFADVAGFSEAQADELEKFVARGGSAVFFLGPAVDAGNYNRRLLERFSESGGLLPGRIGQLVGQAAPAVSLAKDLKHPYLARLYETGADYPDVLVRRYYRVHLADAPVEKILSAPSGETILAAKDYGAGRVVLCATTAGVEWNNLAKTTLLLPVATRICLEAGMNLGGNHTHRAGRMVSIRPRASLPAGAEVVVTPPMPAGGQSIRLPVGKDGLAACKADQVGLYRWQVEGAGVPDEAEGTKGRFVTNPDAAEWNLTRMDPAALASGLAPAEVFFGKSVDEVRAAAAAAAAEENLWDRPLAIVILLLVVEAVAANRFRRGTQPVPGQLSGRSAA